LLCHDAFSRLCLVDPVKFQKAKRRAVPSKLEELVDRAVHNRVLWRDERPQILEEIVEVDAQGLA
jgi:hypothetical protein